MSEHLFGDGSRSAWPDSLWLSRTTPTVLPPVEPGDSADIVIVGAGYTGLWTALHLRMLDSSRSIMVLDAAQPGFGASGRNGGWCSAFAPMSLDEIAAASSPQQARAFQQSLVDTVSEIGTFVASNGIDCGWTQAGTLSLARNAPQLQRVRASIAQARRHGFDESFLRMLEPDEVTSRVEIPSVLAATWSPACAAVDPLALLVGLLRVVQSAGITVRGNSRCVSVEPHSGGNRVRVSVPGGTVGVDCEWLLLCTEGFTAHIPRHRRDIAPLYSYMVATEPLDDATWREIGWAGRETLSDARQMVIYAQRTSDGRIAFGGRGAPYRWASAIGPRHDTNPAVHARIEETMFDLFPAARDARITHRWGGALGVARDWQTTARVDTTSRTGFAGGYVGDGVALSHLASAGLARAVLGIDDEIARLPFVGHRGPQWEPEPLRWLGINGMLRAVALADWIEERTNKPAKRLTSVIERLIG